MKKTFEEHAKILAERGNGIHPCILLEWERRIKSKVPLQEYLKRRLTALRQHTEWTKKIS